MTSSSQSSLHHDPGTFRLPPRQIRTRHRGGEYPTLPAADPRFVHTRRARGRACDVETFPFLHMTLTLWISPQAPEGMSHWPLLQWNKVDDCMAAMPLQACTGSKITVICGLTQKVHPCPLFPTTALTAHTRAAARPLCEA